MAYVDPPYAVRGKRLAARGTQGDTDPYALSENIVLAIRSLYDILTGSLSPNEAFQMVAPDETDFNIMLASGQAFKIYNASGTAVAEINEDGDLDLLGTHDTFYINYIIDGGVATITTGFKGVVQVPSCTITGWSLISAEEGVTGSAKIDVWRSTWAGGLPSNVGSLCGGHEPEIVADSKAQDNDLGDWTSVTLVEGDLLGFNVDSVDTFKRLTLALKCVR